MWMSSNLPAKPVSCFYCEQKRLLHRGGLDPYKECCDCGAIKRNIKSYSSSIISINCEYSIRVDEEYRLSWNDNDPTASIDRINNKIYTNVGKLPKSILDDKKLTAAKIEKILILI
jgi:hypothetical protein